MLSCGKVHAIQLSANNLGWYWIEEIKDPAVLRAALLKNKEVISDVIAPTISLKLPAWCTWPCTPAALEPEQRFHAMSAALQTQPTWGRVLNTIHSTG